MNKAVERFSNLSRFVPTRVNQYEKLLERINHYVSVGLGSTNLSNDEIYDDAYIMRCLQLREEAINIKNYLLDNKISHKYDWFGDISDFADSGHRNSLAHPITVEANNDAIEINYIQAERLKTQFQKLFNDKSFAGQNVAKSFKGFIDALDNLKNLDDNFFNGSFSEKNIRDALNYQFVIAADYITKLLPFRRSFSDNYPEFSKNLITINEIRQSLAHNYYSYVNDGKLNNGEEVTKKLEILNFFKNLYSKHINENGFLKDSLYDLVRSNTTSKLEDFLLNIADNYARIALDPEDEKRNYGKESKQFNIGLQNSSIVKFHEIMLLNFDSIYKLAKNEEISEEQAIKIADKCHLLFNVTIVLPPNFADKNATKFFGKNKPNLYGELIKKVADKFSGGIEDALAVKIFKESFRINAKNSDLNKYNISKEDETRTNNLSEIIFNKTFLNNAKEYSKLKSYQDNESIPEFLKARLHNIFDEIIYDPQISREKIFEELSKRYHFIDEVFDNKNKQLFSPTYGYLISGIYEDDHVADLVNFNSAYGHLKSNINNHEEIQKILDFVPLDKFYDFIDDKIKKLVSEEKNDDVQFLEKVQALIFYRIFELSENLKDMVGSARMLALSEEDKITVENIINEFPAMLENIAEPEFDKKGIGRRFGKILQDYIDLEYPPKLDSYVTNFRELYNKELFQQPISRAIFYNDTGLSKKTLEKYYNNKGEIIDNEGNVITDPDKLPIHKLTLSINDKNVDIDLKIGVDTGLCKLWTGHITSYINIYKYNEKGNKILNEDHPLINALLPSIIQYKKLDKAVLYETRTEELYKNNKEVLGSILAIAIFESNKGLSEKTLSQYYNKGEIVDKEGNVITDPDKLPIHKLTLSINGKNVDIDLKIGVDAGLCRAKNGSVTSYIKIYKYDEQGNKISDESHPIIKAAIEGRKKHKELEASDLYETSCENLFKNNEEFPRKIAEEIFDINTGLSKKTLEKYYNNKGEIIDNEDNVITDPDKLPIHKLTLSVNGKNVDVDLKIGFDTGLCRIESGNITSYIKIYKYDENGNKALDLSNPIVKLITENIKVYRKLDNAELYETACERLHKNNGLFSRKIAEEIFDNISGLSEKTLQQYYNNKGEVIDAKGKVITDPNKLPIHKLELELVGKIIEIPLKVGEEIGLCSKKMVGTTIYLKLYKFDENGNKLLDENHPIVKAVLEAKKDKAISPVKKERAKHNTNVSADLPTAPAEKTAEPASQTVVENLLPEPPIKGDFIPYAHFRNLIGDVNQAIQIINTITRAFKKDLPEQSILGVEVNPEDIKMVFEDGKQMLHLRTEKFEKIAKNYKGSVSNELESKVRADSLRAKVELKPIKIPEKSISHEKPHKQIVERTSLRLSFVNDKVFKDLLKVEGAKPVDDLPNFAKIRESFSTDNRVVKYYGVELTIADFPTPGGVTVLVGKKAYELIDAIKEAQILNASEEVKPNELFENTRSPKKPDRQIVGRTKLPLRFVDDKVFKDLLEYHEVEPVSDLPNFSRMRESVSKQNGVTEYYGVKFLKGDFSAPLGVTMLTGEKAYKLIDAIKDAQNLKNNEGVKPIISDLKVDTKENVKDVNTIAEPVSLHVADNSSIPQKPAKSKFLLHADFKDLIGDKDKAIQIIKSINTAFRKGDNEIEVYGVLVMPKDLNFKQNVLSLNREKFEQIAGNYKHKISPEPLSQVIPNDLTNTIVNNEIKQNTVPEKTNRQIVGRTKLPLRFVDDKVFKDLLEYHEVEPVSDLPNFSRMRESVSKQNGVTEYYGVKFLKGDFSAPLGVTMLTGEKALELVAAIKNKQGLKPNLHDVTDGKQVNSKNTIRE